MRKGTPVFKIRVPFDWAQNPHNDSNWCFQLHCWRMGDKWLREYFETGSFDALRKTFPIVEDWYRFHVKKHGTSDYSWYDMSAGIRAARIAFYLSVTKEAKNHFSSDELNRLAFCLDELAKEHVSFLTKDKNLHKGNHGIFQLHGLALLASYLQDNSAMAYANDRFDRIMGSQFTKNGLHTENSPEYHFFVLNLIERLKLDELFSQSLPLSVLKKANSIRKWLAMPDGRLATFGDTSSRSKWPSTINSKASIKSNSGDHFVKDMSEDGLLVVRNNMEKPDYFATTFSGHSYVHKHADVGQIVFWYKGVQFLSDPGKYIYGKSVERDRVVSAISHGVIDSYPTTLHPTDVKLSHSGSYKLGLCYDEEKITFSVAFYDKKNGAYVRHINYCPGNYLLIRDIAYREQGLYASRLKFNGSLKVDKNGAGYILHDPASGVKVTLYGACQVTLKRNDFGLSREYGVIEPAWVFEAILSSGEFCEWRINLER
nr:heparinase II/III family protein [Paenalcaligenes hominis]